MQNLFNFSALAVTIVLAGCSSTYKYQVKGLPHIVKDDNAISILSAQFARNLDHIWGKDEIIDASKQDYVKYDDLFQTRTQISFIQNKITIETLGDKSLLKPNIVNTLLLSYQPKGFANASDPNRRNRRNRPFLADLVVDNNGKAILEKKQAEKFADYLINHNLESRVLTNGKSIYFVEIPIVANNLEQRALKFLPLARKLGRKYGVKTALLLAIIDVESSFNPLAQSGSNAIGLMQIVPKTAGADIFKRKGYNGIPSKEYLFDPENNVDAGAMYLSILEKEYLSGINNPTSRIYAMISSYNSGPNAVLRIFHQDKQVALSKINRLSSKKVFQILIARHPSTQARNYLQKVNQAYLKYQKIQ